MIHDANDINSSLQFRNNLISALLHESKGLTANIFWLIEMIENGLDNDSVKNMIPELKTVVTKNIEDLNNFSQWIKMQKDASEIHAEEIDLNDILSELKNMFIEQLSQKNQELIISTTEFNKIYSDYFLFKLALKNIIKSAIEHSDNEEKIVVSYERAIEKNEITIIFKKIDTRYISDNFDISYAKEIALLLRGKVLIGDDCVFLSLPLKTNL